MLRRCDELWLCEEWKIAGVQYRVIREGNGDTNREVTKGELPKLEPLEPIEPKEAR